MHSKDPPMEEILIVDDKPANLRLLSQMLSDRGYVLATGRMVMSGTGQELLANPEIRTAYLEGGH